MNEEEKNIAGLIKAQVRKKDPSAEVILFGSHARGQANKNSDWDILILLNIPEVNRKLEREYRDVLFDIELEIEQPISTFVFSKTRWESLHVVSPLYLNIKREGVYL